MSHFVYLGVIGFCLLATVWLEVFLRTRVYARPVRLGLSLLPGFAVFVVWDLYAIANDHWGFSERYLTGVVLPGRLPLEEALFFIVIPVCSILTLEAVRSRRPHWAFGDEAGAADPADRAGPAGSPNRADPAGPADPAHAGEQE